MRLFGRSKKKEAEGPQESVIKMRDTLEMLEKKEKHLDMKIQQETDTARQYAVSNKQSKSTVSFFVVIMVICSGPPCLKEKENV